MQKQDKNTPDFLKIEFEEYFYAIKEGKHLDSSYVKKKSYERYEKELKEHGKAVHKETNEN